MLNRRHWAAALAAFGLFASSGTSLAQAAYPNKPINMVVGFAAGSATDIVARVISQKLSDRLGQPVVVQNITGAAG